MRLSVVCQEWEVRGLPGLPRSTQAGRGELAGAASCPRQVRAVTVHIEALGPGMLRLSQPAVPGWAVVARTPSQLNQLVAAAFTEAQVAAYSRWRGHVYDGTDPASPPDPASPVYRRPRPARRGHRVDAHPAEDWRIRGDGRWVSPGTGRTWRPDSQVVARVQARRVQQGLSASPDPAADSRPGRQVEVTTLSRRGPGGRTRIDVPVHSGLQLAE